MERSRFILCILSARDIDVLPKDQTRDHKYRFPLEYFNYLAIYIPGQTVTIIRALW